MKQDPETIYPFFLLSSFFESSRLLTFSEFVVDNNRSWQQAWLLFLAL
jgi:hypothetical protein